MYRSHVMWENANFSPPKIEIAAAASEIGMAMSIPAIPLLPALYIQGYGIHFYTIFLSVYGS